jgi:hypothetical protein
MRFGAWLLYGKSHPGLAATAAPAAQVGTRVAAN